MKVFLDTSVVLRVVFADAERLSSWGEWDSAYASELLTVEAQRRLFNARLEGLFDDDSIVPALNVLREITDNLTLVKLSDPILTRASAQFPRVTGTLDALHLSSALALLETGVDDLVFATHDEQQGRTASAVGLEVIGLSPGR